jgi:hypothetical protein
MFAIKCGPVMGPKQLHIHHEAVILSNAICQTDIATLLDCGLQKQFLSKCCVQNKMVCPFFGIDNALCLLINVCVHCRCETNFRTLYIQLTSTTCFGEKQQLASSCLSILPSVCLSVRRRGTIRLPLDGPS